MITTEQRNTALDENPYLDWVHDLYIKFRNDYLTIEVFAEHHGFTEDFAKAIIDYGRKLNKGELEVFYNH